MNNIFSLESARQLREKGQASKTVSVIEDAVYTAIRRASLEKWNARRTVDEVIGILSNGIESGDIEEKTVTSLTGNRQHLLRGWLETLTQYVSYLHTLRFHLATGRQDLMVEDGLAIQGDDPFPEPMLFTGFGLDPHDDGTVYASASLASRTMWFDGEFQNLDGPAVSHHPETETGQSATKNLDEPPHVRWRSDVNTAKRGLVHPGLINAVVSEFFLSALACNMGVGYSFDDGRHRFSYLEAVGLSTVVEWSFVIHSEVYEVYGL